MRYEESLPLVMRVAAEATDADTQALRASSVTKDLQVDAVWGTTDALPTLNFAGVLVLGIALWALALPSALMLWRAGQRNRDGRRGALRAGSIAVALIGLTTALAVSLAAASDWSLRGRYQETTCTVTDRLMVQRATDERVSGRWARAFSLIRGVEFATPAGTVAQVAGDSDAMPGEYHFDDDARQRFAALQPGQAYPCWYDPNRPREVTLQFSRSQLLYYALGGVLLLVSMPWFRRRPWTATGASDVARAPRRRAQSRRNAVIGSTVIARRAGTQAAARATLTSSDAASAIVGGSMGRTPNSKVLGQELTTEQARGGAERRPDRHLGLAMHEPGQREVADVRARDDQDEARRDEQNHQHRPHLRGELVLPGRDHRVEAAGRRIRCRIGVLEIPAAACGCRRCMMRSASGYGSGRSSTPLMTLKIAVLAPMPRPRVRINAAENHGILARLRRAMRMSVIMTAPGECVGHASQRRAVLSTTDKTVFDLTNRGPDGPVKPLPSRSFDAERPTQFFDPDRLRDVGIHARGEASLAIPLHGMRRHGDDAGVAARPLFAQPNRGGGLEAAHLGHLDVHENGIELLVGRRRDGRGSVLDDGHGVALSFQHGGRDALVDGVVFGHQHTEPAARRHARDPRAGLARRTRRRIAECRRDCRKQRRARHRLDETLRQSQLPASRLITGAIVGGHHQHRRARQRRAAAECARPLRSRPCRACERRARRGETPRRVDGPLSGRPLPPRHSPQFRGESPTG